MKNGAVKDTILDDVLDELDEIVSAILPGMAILSYNELIDRVKSDNPKKFAIDQDQGRVDYSCNPIRYRRVGPPPEWPSREQQPSTFLDTMQKRIEWLRRREMM